MLKRISQITCIVLTALLLSACTTTNQQQPTASLQPSSVSQNSSEEVTPATTQRYVEYTKSALDENKNKRRVLFFYANWCPTCKPANEEFQQNMSQIPEDVVVIRVNYNDTATDLEEKALAKKYDVAYQHTYVQIDSANNKVTIWNGGQLKELLQNIK